LQIHNSQIWIVSVRCGKIEVFTIYLR
jgi:hypothetical protein